MDFAQLHSFLCVQNIQTCSQEVRPHLGSVLGLSIEGRIADDGAHVPSLTHFTQI